MGKRFFNIDFQIFVKEAARLDEKLAQTPETENDRYYSDHHYNSLDAELYYGEEAGCFEEATEDPDL